MRDLLKVVLSLVLAMASGQALADLPIVLVDEARLPYDYSPSNYDISPSNYDNSISNYDNSPSNYDNSESNSTIIVHPITTIVATEIVGLYIAQMGLALSPATTSLPTMGQRTSFPHLAKGCSTPQKGGAASMAAKMGASAGHWSS